MITIGLYSPKHASLIKQTLKALFDKYNIKYTFIKPTENTSNSLSLLSNSNIKIAIIFIDKTLIKNIYFDILIYDNEKSCKSPTPDLIKCISAKTILIANGDIPPPPISIKIMAINYGLATKSTVTASSVNSDDKYLEFVYCLQRKIYTLTDNEIEPKEIKFIINTNDISVYHAMPVITTALLCDIELDNIIEI